MSFLLGSLVLRLTRDAALRLVKPSKENAIGLLIALLASAHASSHRGFVWRELWANSWETVVLPAIIAVLGLFIWYLFREATIIYREESKPFANALGGTTRTPPASLKIRLLVALQLALVVPVSLAAWTWNITVLPLALEVSPAKLNFTSALDAEILTVRVTNNSDDEIYSSDVNLRVESDEPHQNYSIDVPKESRKPMTEVGVAGQHLADIQLMACWDTDDHSLFIISIYKMGPRESREITVTHHAMQNAVVSVTPGTYWLEPHPITSNDKEASLPFYSNHPMGRGGSGRVYGFHVEDTEYKGMELLTGGIRPIPQ